MKQLSVVIGSYNRLKFLKLAIESIRRELDQCRFVSEIIVVDGGSTDGTLTWLMKQKDIISIVQHNRGEWDGKVIERRSWGYFMNLGFKCAQGKYVCMLSDDCLVVPGAIKNGVELFDARIGSGEKVGAAAFYWRNWPEQERYWVGVSFDTVFVNHGLFLRDALKMVNYIDEEYYHFYHADSDLSLRIAVAGFSIVVSEESYIEHHSHANISVRESNMTWQKNDWNNYLTRWGDSSTDNSKCGEWIYKEYFDPNRTASAFKTFPEHVRNITDSTFSTLKKLFRGK